jgi:hypothetical protein
MGRSLGAERWGSLSCDTIDERKVSRLDIEDWTCLFGIVSSVAQPFGRTNVMILLSSVAQGGFCLFEYSQ